MTAVRRPPGALAPMLALAALVGMAQARTKDAPAPAPVPLSISLSETGPERPWLVTVENTSAEEVTVLDDPALVWLEVALPGAEKPSVCRLPDSLLPGEKGAKKASLSPGEKLEQRIDPRFYCFGPTQDDALVPTAQVTPHYGWPTAMRRRWVRGKKVEEPAPDKAPFVAHPAGEGTASGPRKNVVGNPVVLGEAYRAWAPPPPGSERKEEPIIEVQRGSDADDELRVTATVKISNPTGNRLHLFVRRELVTFEVLTHHGPVACEAGPDERNPDRRAFSTVAPGGSVSFTSRLVELCPRGTFSSAGIYLLRAKLEATVDGAEQGLDAFTGTIESRRPARVRVHRTIQIVQNRPAAGQRGPGMSPPPLQAAVPVAPPPPPAPVAAPPPPQ